jgi:nucleotide-binding universal stress UspA family protein
MEGVRNLLVGFEGSPLSWMAVRRALLFSRSASFALVHVVVVVERVGNDYLLPSGERLSPHAALDFARLSLTQQAREWGLDSPHVRLILHLRVGAPGRCLVDLAYRFAADIVLVGAHGSDAPQGYVGSVAREVLDYTHDMAVHVESDSGIAKNLPSSMSAEGVVIPWERLGPAAVGRSAGGGPPS